MPSVLDREKFVDDVVNSFKKVKPDWKPPHLTIFAVAKRHRAKALINGKDEAWWKANWNDRFEDLDDGLMDTPKVKIGGVDMTFEWLDCGSIRLKKGR